MGLPAGRHQHGYGDVGRFGHPRHKGPERGDIDSHFQRISSDRLSITQQHQDRNFGEFGDLGFHRRGPRAITRDANICNIITMQPRCR